MEGTIKINVGRAIFAVFRQWLLILIAGVVAFMLATVFTYRPEADMYRATSTVYAVASSAYSSATSPDTVLRTYSVLRSYSQVALSNKVLDRAASFMTDSSITGDTLSGMVGVSYQDDSSILTIQVSSPSPALAVQAANAVSEAFVAEIRVITGQNNVMILDSADRAALQSSGFSRQWRIRAIAAAGAVLVVAVIILLKDVFSTRITELSDATLEGELELLGVIPSYQNKVAEIKFS